MVRKSRIKYLLIKELTKFTLFSLITILIISVLQSRSEKIANQFDLNEETQLFYKKNFSHIKNNQEKICPLYPKELEGLFNVDLSVIPSLEDLKRQIPNLEEDGSFKPRSCIPREKLAIIIPYRNRLTNLVLLLKYLHPMLQKQSRYYRVFLVEQYGDDVFNKGRIMNIAVNEALKVDNFNCFIFHDVDLIPENDRNIYECYIHPRHLSIAIDELRYNLMYFNLVGGVLALNLDQLNKTNGYSNLYWGWGAEDDDMSMRILDNGYEIMRPTNQVGRYKMILHGKRSRAINRFELLEYWKRYKRDGLNSLKDLKYEIKSLENNYLYTNITVDIGPSVIESVDKKQIKHSKFNCVGHQPHVQLKLAVLSPNGHGHRQHQHVRSQPQPQNNVSDHDCLLAIPKNSWSSMNNW
ncbi:beta-1-4-galactosyltransferase 1-like [Brachionus plicatilis]|uniref:Beta-1,4-galactosyltransferase n=1 Tax=Brachionus plicatilis TaxID=10195 RepID=A0A3M7RZJ8_BRAPC|nr:beta-1-4-galactosyltransferase 1-like [Brachionus plicatilis]